jgi:hypothetical protein
MPAVVPVVAAFVAAVTVEAVVTGAIIGAVTAAVSGGNILKGALMGGITGGIMSGASGAISYMANGATTAGTGLTAAGESLAPGLDSASSMVAPPTEAVNYSLGNSNTGLLNSPMARGAETLATDVTAGGASGAMPVPQTTAPNFPLGGTPTAATTAAGDVVGEVVKAAPKVDYLGASNVKLPSQVGPATLGEKAGDSFLSKVGSKLTSDKAVETLGAAAINGTLSGVSAAATEKSRTEAAEAEADRRRMMQKTVRPKAIKFSTQKARG